MWDQARKIVDDTFFRDEIELYRNDIRKIALAKSMKWKY